MQIVVYITDPLGQPKVTAGRDNCCPSVPNFKSRKTKQQQTMFANSVWVWPSGSLMTPFLLYFALTWFYRNNLSDYIC